MDEIVAKGVAVIVREFAHLREVDLIVILEAVEDVFKVFGVARYIKSYSDHCNQMMHF